MKTRRKKQLKWRNETRTKSKPVLCLLSANALLCLMHPSPPWLSSLLPGKVSLIHLCTSNMSESLLSNTETCAMLRPTKSNCPTQPWLLIQFSAYLETHIWDSRFTGGIKHEYWTVLVIILLKWFPESRDWSISSKGHGIWNKQIEVTKEGQALLLKSLWIRFLAFLSLCGIWVCSVKVQSNCLS